MKTLKGKQNKDVHRKKRMETVQIQYSTHWICPKEDTILVYRRGTNGIQKDRTPQCRMYKIVLYRQSYQVGYWRVPTVRYLPLSRLPTLSPHFSQEGTNQLCVPSMSNNIAGAILWYKCTVYTVKWVHMYIIAYIKRRVCPFFSLVYLMPLSVILMKALMGLITSFYEY